MKKTIEILKSEINIGIEKPFRILQMTDSHIVFDEPGRNTGRNEIFSDDYDRCWADYFCQVLEYAKKENLTIIHTGDIVDFISEGSLEYVKEKMAEVDYIVAPGNHDFIQCWGDEEETSEYKSQGIKKIAPVIKNNMYFYSRVINGVNFVAIDDSYYKISEGQLDLLKAEVAKGLPVIVCMHIPLFTDEFAKIALEKWKVTTALLAPSEEIMKHYSEKAIINEKADEQTEKAVEYIKKEPLIKAVIAGHVHLNFEEQLADDFKQICTLGSCRGCAREIVIR